MSHFVDKTNTDFVNKTNIDTHDNNELLYVIGTIFSGENTNILSYITDYFNDPDFIKILGKYEHTLNSIKINNPTPGIKGVLDNHDLLIELAEWFLLTKNKRVILSFLEIVIKVLKDNKFIISDAPSKYAIFLSEITNFIDTLKDIKYDTNTSPEAKKNNIELNHDHITYIIIFLIFTIKQTEIIDKIGNFNDLINKYYGSITCIIDQITTILKNDDNSEKEKLKRILIDTIFKNKTEITNNDDSNNKALNIIVFKTISILNQINQLQTIKRNIFVKCEVIIINESSQIK